MSKQEIREDVLEIDARELASPQKCAQININQKKILLSVGFWGFGVLGLGFRV